MLPERNVLVGIDLGTSAVKILACTPSGKHVASAATSYPLDTPRPGSVEQDANTVYRAAMRALQDVLAEIRLRGDDVLAIGFSCAMHGLVPVDARGEPLGPLITWMDQRSAAIADRARSDGTAGRLYAITGAPMHPMLPSCKLRWFTDHPSETPRGVAKFVSLKELFVFRWTGEWLVDWGMASGTGLYDLRTRDWSDEALAFAGISRDLLSIPLAPRTIRRASRGGVAGALGISDRTAIVLASSDGALANLGVGAIDASQLALTLGTSGALRTVVDEAHFDERGRTFCYAFDDTQYIVGGATSSAGAVINALTALFLSELAPEARFPKAVALAQTVTAGASGISVMPFLSGERAPYWLANLRGAIVGLDLSHSRADILRAAFESVVFALATVRDAMRDDIDPPQHIRLSGGLNRAPFVRQLVADVFACEASLTDQSEASAYGAAMMAGLAVGALADHAAVAATLTPTFEHRPQPAAVHTYRSVYARYREVVDANLALFAKAALKR